MSGAATEAPRLAARLAASRAAGARALAPYLTLGDGGLGRTLAVLRACDRPDVACVELGLPFSDPVADGPVLQAAAARALDGGTTFDGLLATLRALRAGDAEHDPSDLPVVVMGYLNPLLRRGLERACDQLAEAGADGVLVADVPFEESTPLRAAASSAGLACVQLVAPNTSPARRAAIVQASRGFVYAIGRFGVTGAATTFGDEAQQFLHAVRADAGDLPLAVGFGIGDAAAVRAAVTHADLAVVGSAFVRHLHAAGGDDATAGHAARAFLDDLARGLRDPTPGAPT